MGGHLTLHEDRGAIGIKTDRQQLRKRGQGPLVKKLRIVFHGDRMLIDHAVEGVVGLLEAHPLTQRSQVVADVEGISGRLDSRQHPRA